MGKTTRGGGNGESSKKSSHASARNLVDFHTILNTNRGTSQGLSGCPTRKIPESVTVYSEGEGGVGSEEEIGEVARKVEE